MAGNFSSGPREAAQSIGFAVPINGLRDNSSGFPGPEQGCCRRRAANSQTPAANA
jgi:hypothetical protein